METTFTDHFTIIAKTPLNPCVKEKEPDIVKPTHRNLKAIKGESSLKFLFYLNHTLNKPHEYSSIDEKTSFLARTITEALHKFAPEEKPKPYHNSSEQQWITNKIKNNIVKRDKLFNQERNRQYD